MARYFQIEGKVARSAIAKGEYQDFLLVVKDVPFLLCPLSGLRPVLTLGGGGAASPPPLPTSPKGRGVRAGRMAEEARG